MQSNAQVSRLSLRKARECLLAYISDPHPLTDWQFDDIADSLEAFGIAPTAYVPRIH